MIANEVTDSKDPALEAELDRALAPYRDLVSAEDLAMLREELEEALTQHHVGKALMSASRPRAVTQQSGDRVVEGNNFGDENATQRAVGDDGRNGKP